MSAVMEPENALMLLVTLEVRPDALSEFRAYEMRAAGIMAKHGGRIVQTMVLEPSKGESFITEVHIVTFPDGDALASYREDAELRALLPVRDRVVARTAIRVGRVGPSYSPQSAR